MDQDVSHRPDPRPESKVLEKEMVLMSKGRIVKNMLILNFSCCLYYSGFWALTNLQSTMNAAGGIGPASQAAVYLCSTISCLFLPELCIQNFGCKKVLIAGTILCLPYTAANVYLRWESLMGSAVLLGLATGPFTAAQAVYVNELANRYKSMLAENAEFLMACFFGVYYFFVDTAQIWGNVLSSFVIKSGSLPANTSESKCCGIHFELFSNISNSNLEPPSEGERWLLVAIFFGIGIVSVILLKLCLDPLNNDIKKNHKCAAILNRFVSSVKHFKTFHQLLLIPLTLSLSIESVLYSNEFTQAYIACSWGVHHVGFVTVCFGVCGALMSLAVGPLVKCISQMAVLILAACANVAICTVLFLWDPNPEQPIVYFVIAGVWGMGDAIWWSQVTALYGLMFPNDREAAFSNLYFWSFLGFFLSYSYANVFTVTVKINILLGFLLTGMMGYMIGQIKLKCDIRKEYASIPDNDEEQ